MAAATQKEPMSVSELRTRRVYLFRGLLVLSTLALIWGFVLFLFSQNFWAVAWAAENWWVLLLLVVFPNMGFLMYTGALCMMDFVLLWLGVSKQNLRLDIRRNVFAIWHRDQINLSSD